MGEGAVLKRRTVKQGDTSSKGPCVSRHCHPEFLMQTGANCGFFNIVIIRLVRIRD